MIYLAIFVWFLIVLLPIEFVILDFKLSMKHRIGLIKKITKTDNLPTNWSIVILFTLMYVAMVFYIAIVCLDVNYLTSNLSHWLSSKIENKILLIIVMNIFIFSGLFWVLRVTSDVKFFLLNFNIKKNTYFWFCENQNNRKLIFKVIRKMQINSGIKPDNIFEIMCNMIVKNGWIKYRNYNYLLDGNTIKMKDENSNILAFSSYKEFTKFELKATK